MSWLFSQALVAAYSADTSLAGVPSALSNGNLTPQAYCAPDKMTAFSQLSRFGMTFEPLTEDRGAALLTSYLAAFRAQTYQPLEKAQALKEKPAACGATWPASSVKYCRDSSLWKTAHCLWEEALPWSSVILPRWGMTRNGHVLAHPTAERPISETGSGLWQTPVPDDACNRANGKFNNRGEPKLSAQVIIPTPTVCGNYNRASTDDRLDYTVERQSFQPGQQTPPMRLNPEWVEWLMGWPLGWTDLKPLAMDKFREWQQQHSLCYQDNKPCP